MNDVIKKIPSWYTIFLKNSGGLSSKRVCGFFGWLICIGIFIGSFVTGKNIPEYGELLAVLSTSLLGLDSITGIWSKSINKS